jgi:SAM-dependent methyltransferase
MSESPEGWTDYWKKDGAGGEVFVNAKGEAHPALADFWQAAFADAPAGARVIDIASGAGSVFAHLPEAHGCVLTASDISGAALESLSTRIPEVTTLVCSADDMPLDDGSFDLVVTQFGIEYAGVAAFDEAARLLAPGGRFVGLCHYRDGYIDSDNRAQLDEARIVQERGFIDAAIALAKAAFSGVEGELKKAQDVFVDVATPVGEGMRRHRKGIHTYLFQGFRRLYEHRRQYDLVDVTGWLDAMRGELEKTIDRLERMRAAALSPEDVEEIRRLFEARGLGEVHCTPFETPGNELPVAWKVTALKEDSNDRQYQDERDVEPQRQDVPVRTAGTAVARKARDDGIHARGATVRFRAARARRAADDDRVRQRPAHLPDHLLGARKPGAAGHRRRAR